MFIQSLQEAKIEKITMDIFLDKVSKFSSLDQALVELDQAYLEFYMNNQKKADKSLKSLNIHEATAETPGYAGFAAPQATIYKKIKYRGEIMVLKYDDELRLWIPLPAFRSIVQAMSYSKNLIDNL